MLPDNMELQTPKTKEWSLIPADVYQTEITNIEYKIEPNRYKKVATDLDEKQVMIFEFTIIEEGPMYGRKLWQKMAPIKPYPPHQNGKATWIYRLASAMEGHSISRDEADRFGSSNINGYIHRQVRLTVKHSEPKDGKQYNNVESFLPIKTELPLFDEAKVPKENQPEPKNEPSGYEKLKATADYLKSGNQPEYVAPDIAEEAERMANEELPTIVQGEDLNVEDIPF